MFHLRPQKRRSAFAAAQPTLAGLATLLACSAVCAAQPNLISNGGFELNTSFDERPDVPRVADLSGSAPTGWARDSGDVAEYMARTPPYQGVTIYNPASGDYFIGAHDGEWWEQSFATTPGTAYTLTYSSAYGAAWWLNIASYYRPGVAPGEITLTGDAVLLTASVVGTAAAPTGATLLDSPFVWSAHTLSFAADSNLTTLRFAGSTTVPDGGFIFIDDVSVTSAVPEPKALWQALAGLSGFGLAIRRRRAR